MRVERWLQNGRRTLLAPWLTSSYISTGWVGTLIYFTSCFAATSASLDNGKSAPTAHYFPRSHSKPLAILYSIRNIYLFDGVEKWSVYAYPFIHSSVETRRHGSSSKITWKSGRNDGSILSLTDRMLILTALTSMMNNKRVSWRLSRLWRSDGIEVQALPRDFTGCMNLYTLPSRIYSNFWTIGKLKVYLGR